MFSSNGASSEEGACEAEAFSPFDDLALHGAASKELIARRSLLHARDRILLGVLVFSAVQQLDFPSWSSSFRCRNEVSGFC